VGGDLKAIRLFCLAVALASILAAASVQAQEPATEREQSQEDALLRSTREVALNNFGLTDLWATNVSPANLPQDQDPPRTNSTTQGTSPVPDAPKPEASPSTPTKPDEEYGKQNKRILWVIPNYRAVSANTHLPPLSFKSELWLATQDTFDYSDFIFVAGLAGVDMAGKSQPSFGHGAEGYGKYYWHVFVDGAIENYMTEAIVPWPTKEDPRYYTMGKGGFAKRTGYAVSRLFITRTNSGGSTFNLSEVVGAGAAAGIGNAYYPAEHNPWVKTYQRWGTQVGLDGVFNVLKEFWPDIDRAVFGGKF
jgi:hypothetical protein